MGMASETGQIDHAMQMRLQCKAAGHMVHIMGLPHTDFILRGIWQKR